jgi:hypothetical protein
MRFPGWSKGCQVYHEGKAAGQAKAGGRDSKADGTRAVVSFTYETHHRSVHVAYETTHDSVDMRQTVITILRPPEVVWKLSTGI